MRNIPIGWLQSHHLLLSRIMMHNLWPLSRNSNITIRRAKFLYAIIKRVPFGLCKHIVQTMMEMLEEHQMGLPYGCLVTRICMQVLQDIPASELEVKPGGAFGKHIVVQIIILASARIVCNIVLCKCEVDPTGNCVAKINLYSN
jgi:hypothetical protein